MISDCNPKLQSFYVLGDNMIYFDNGATSGKKPEIVLRSINNCLKNYNANPGRSGHNLSVMAAEKVFETRKKIADFFGAKEPENVIFTANCTHSLNYVIKGILSRNDHVVVSELEHNAVMRPLHKTVSRYDMATVSFLDDKETVENFKNLINKNTKMIICTAASNVCGKMLPLKEIGRLCKDNNILFTVDAAQGAGIMPINMEEMGIDFLCIAPHKGLFSPMGIGILIAAREIPQTIIEGGTGSDSLNLNQPQIMPEMLESGTVNLPGIFGVSAGIDFIKKVGKNNIYSHEMSLIQYIYKNLSKMENVILYTPFPQLHRYAPVLSFNIMGLTSDETASLLNKRGIYTRAGLHCAPFAHKKLGTQDTGTVRVSLGYYNTRNEAEYFIKTVRNLQKSNKILQFGID